jgi:hypothetical protein
MCEAFAEQALRAAHGLIAQHALIRPRRPSFLAVGPTDALSSGPTQPQPLPLLVSMPAMLVEALLGSGGHAGLAADPVLGVRLVAARTLAMLASLPRALCLPFPSVLALTAVGAQLRLPCRPRLWALRWRCCRLMEWLRSARQHP